jgi:hypothetical protein
MVSEAELVGAALLVGAAVSVAGALLAALPDPRSPGACSVSRLLVALLVELVAVLLDDCWQATSDRHAMTKRPAAETTLTRMG